MTEQNKFWFCPDPFALGDDVKPLSTDVVSTHGTELGYLQNDPMPHTVLSLVICKMTPCHTRY